MLILEENSEIEWIRCRVDRYCRYVSRRGLTSLRRSRLMSLAPRVPTGRMQDNEPLMRALSKVCLPSPLSLLSPLSVLMSSCSCVQLISVNQPDKIIFVGEALVGNEAVDQLVKFDRSLRDFSASSGGGSGGGGKKEARGIDGMILTK